jgi:hypothetical protein
MNGVQASGVFSATGAFPASTVLRIANNRPMKAAENRQSDEVILAAVTHPPRIGQPRPLADLLPQVLARYGLVEEAATQESTDVTTVDLLA